MILLSIFGVQVEVSVSNLACAYVHMQLALNMFMWVITFYRYV